MPDYQVGNAPSGASYTPPRVDFSAIGNAPDTYFKGTQQRRVLALQNAFPNGIPVDERGQPDFRSMANTLIKLGGADAAQQTLGMWLGQEAAGQVGRAIAGTEGQGGGQPEPRPHSVDTGPANITMGQQPRLSSRGTDNAGADTIRSLATELSGGQDANGLIRAAAMQFRVGPDQELSPEQAQVIKDRLSQLRTGGGGPPASANDLPGPSPSGMVAGPGVPPQNGGQPAAQPGPGAPSASGPQAAPVGPTPQQQPGPVAPAQPGQGGNVLAVPPQFSPAVRDRYVKTIALLNAAAANPNLPAASQKAAADQATALKDRVKTIDEFWSKRGEVPPDVKSALSEGTTVSGLKAREEQNKQEIDRFSKVHTALAGAGMDAQHIVQQTELFRSILNDPKFYSGTGEGLSLAYKKALASFGGDPNAAVPQEAFRKIMATNILNQVAQMKADAAASGSTSSRIFQSQIALMEKAAQNPDNSIAANRFLTELSYRLSKRQVEMADMADKYAISNGRLDPKFTVQMRKYDTDHPIFNDDELRNPALLSAPRFRSTSDALRSREKPGTLVIIGDKPYHMPRPK